jgi:hypothetical protein
MVTIAGTVQADSSLQPLRFVRVRDLGSATSVLTDRYGHFTIRIPFRTSDRITLTCTLLGYVTDTVSVLPHDTTILISLREKVIRGAELFVSAEDPARTIMRRVVERKRRQEDSLQSYTYMLYTKFIATTDTITAMRSTGMGDSTIVSILESFSKGYYKYKNNYFNEIIQRRQTANVPSQANSVTFGTNLNAYEDAVTILGEAIDSPFAANALEIYDYILRSDNEEDTVKIEVHPKSSLRRAFVGVIYIDQRNGIPIEVELVPTNAVNLPFNAAVRYRQTFQTQQGMVVPEALSIQSTLQASLFWIVEPRLDVDIETFCYDYNINRDIPDYVFDQKRVEILPEASVYDSMYWNANAKLPLRPEEARAYDEINSFVNNPDSLENSLLNRFFGPIRQGIAMLRRPPFTGFDDILRYNGIHGLYLGLGLTHNIGGVFSTKITGGYGTLDNQWYYSGATTIPLDAREKLNIALTHGRELLRRDNPNLVRQNLITTTALLFGSDYGDYYYSTRTSVGASYSWGQLRFIGQDQFVRPSRVEVRYTSSDDRTARSSDLWHIFPRRDTLRPNPAVAEGHLSSISGNLFLDFFPTRRISRRGLQLSFETSGKQITGGDFDFSLMNFQGFFRTATLPLWTLDVYVGGSWSWGAVPPQRFMSTESGFNGIVVGNAFRGMRVKEFYGDRSFELTMSHNFGEVVPGVLRIPNIASFGLELITFGGFAWTSFSDETRERYNPQLQTTAETADQIYYDVGVSINRILIFLRLDISARLSQRDVPQLRFTVSNALF